MRLVVADTGPINYLVLVDVIDLLPKLFSTVLVPATVYRELGYPGAPMPVQDWIANIPDWLEV